MQHRILHHAEFFNQVLFDVSINVTEMFRDSGFYQPLREEVIPITKYL